LRVLNKIEIIIELLVNKTIEYYKKSVHMGCCASEETGLQNQRLDGIGKLEKKDKDVGAMGASAAKDDPTAGRKKLYAKNKPI